MIELVIFDLDGTLVQSERLKAQSYARAAVELCPRTLAEDDVIEAFKEVVGLSRREVAQHLVDRFDLADRATARQDEFGVRTAWQAFVQVRLVYYSRMLANTDLLRKSQWPHSVALLKLVREQGCLAALATMSRCEMARRVLKALELTEAFDFVATRDDVERGKPDPEIYHLVAAQLHVENRHCLVIEDSPSGVQAALEAGMACVAVSTPFTRRRLHESSLLLDRWIIDRHETLPDVVRQRMAEQG